MPYKNLPFMCTCVYPVISVCMGRYVLFYLFGSHLLVTVIIVTLTTVNKMTACHLK